VDDYYHPDPDEDGVGYAKHGSFLQGAQLFDHRLFRIAHFEAVFMHPQQRVSLEVCYQALQRAGYNQSSLTGSSTAVYVGQMNND
jgi:acyl transferase domain-containing protein